MAASARSKAASRRPAAPSLLGHEEPRVFTPPLRKLTPKTSLGFSVIEFAEVMLGIELYPWQRWLLIHALELLPDNTFRFRNVVVLVARQNGKSTLSQVLALWFMYVYGFNLILGTAQDLDTAEEVWQGAVDLVLETDDDDNPIRPELFDLHERVVMVNGKKSLDLKPTRPGSRGSRYKVKAANRRAGRGLSGDLILLDELREHQTWDAWGAITKTTMARALAMIWALSNAGDAASIVLRYLRKMAHAALGDPDGINAEDDPEDFVPEDDDELSVDADDTLGIFEWSAPPGCAVTDRQGWAMANPSLGHKTATGDGISERVIASACKTDPEWVFRTEVLCQWSDGTLEGPFPTGSWDECRDASSGIAADSPMFTGLDVSWNRSMSHIGVAGWRDDGSPHTEIMASRTGTDWVVPWFTDPAYPHRAKFKVVIQASGAPASSLIEPLEQAGIEVIPWKGTDLGKACGAFYDLVSQKDLWHLPQPILDVAAATAVSRPMNDAWVWDRKNSPNDAAPLLAATAAVWGLHLPVEDDTPPPAPVSLSTGKTKTDGSVMSMNF